MHAIPPSSFDDDLDVQDVARLRQVLDATLARPAQGMGDVLAKLHALASYYEGGEVPAVEVADVAGEMAVLLF